MSLSFIMCKTELIQVYKIGEVRCQMILYELVLSKEVLREL